MLGYVQHYLQTYQNWTKQKWFPDQTLITTKYCLREFGAAISDERADFIDHERGRLQQHMYSVKHLIITNFGLPRRKLPPKPPTDYEQKAADAIDAIIPITPVKGIK